MNLYNIHVPCSCTMYMYNTAVHCTIKYEVYWVYSGCYDIIIKQRTDQTFGPPAIRTRYPHRGKMEILVSDQPSITGFIVSDTSPYSQVRWSNENTTQLITYTGTHNDVVIIYVDEHDQLYASAKPSGKNCSYTSSEYSALYVRPLC